MLNVSRKTLAIAIVTCTAALLAACEENPAAPARVAPPAAAASAAPVSRSGVRTYAVAQQGRVSFLIDAPLEKIKGRAEKLRGNLQVDPGDLRATRGQISVDLKDLKTETFDAPGKDARQTEHAHNWLQLGADVPDKEREENRWVHFTIRSIRSASAHRVADVPDEEGKRSVSVVAAGDVWLHGVSAAKTVKLAVVFEGPAAAPTSIHVTSADPLIVSIKEHDVKPRDVAGRFLEGALERVGQKIDDRVQVSIDLTAVAPRSDT